MSVALIPLTMFFELLMRMLPAVFVTPDLFHPHSYLGDGRSALLDRRTFHVSPPEKYWNRSLRNGGLAVLGFP